MLFINNTGIHLQLNGVEVNTEEKDMDILLGICTFVVYMDIQIYLKRIKCPSSLPGVGEHCEKAQCIPCRTQQAWELPGSAAR